MKVLKIFNNNAIVAVDELLGDIVVLGAGIGFQKKVNDEVEKSKIEKTYIFERNSRKRFEESLKQVPTKYYEVTTQIIKKAEKELDTDFNSEIFISISDHIDFAIRRKKENVYLPNIILNETKTLYRKEYSVGIWALQYIKDYLHIELEEDEAGYIALHIVNYSINNKSNNASKVISFTKDTLKIIELTLKIELERDSLAYARLSTHLKYLAERIFRREAEDLDTTSSIRDLLIQEEQLYLCMDRIKKMIFTRYDYELSPDEETFLIIHIKNNINLVNKNMKSCTIKNLVISVINLGYREIHMETPFFFT